MSKKKQETHLAVWNIFSLWEAVFKSFGKSLVINQIQALIRALQTYESEKAENAPCKVSFQSSIKSSSLLRNSSVMRLVALLSSLLRLAAVALYPIFLNSLAISS